MQASPDSTNSLYINKGNRDIVNPGVSIIIYFIEFNYQTENKAEFLTFKNFKVTNTQYT